MSEHFARKSEGQHMLKNHGLIDTIIAKSKLKSTDIALEIGAGTGNITSKLLQKAKKVIAYEADKSLAKELRSRICKKGDLKNKLELIEGDALFHDFPHFDICISNIPFNISLPIILKLIACDFKCAYILVQKEFGDRLTASPGSQEYSRLSVITQLLAHVSHVMKVSKNSFSPPPKVDSCFVRIEPRVPRPPIDLTEFDNLLKICFGRKNKTLCANLKSATSLKNLAKPGPSNAPADPRSAADSGRLIEDVLERIGLLDARTSKMTVEDFLRLLLEFKRCDAHFDKI